MTNVHIFPLFQLAASDISEWLSANYTQIHPYEQGNFSLLIRLKLGKEVQLANGIYQEIQSSKKKCVLFNKFSV